LQTQFRSRENTREGSTHSVAASGVKVESINVIIRIAIHEFHGNLVFGPPDMVHTVYISTHAAVAVGCLHCCWDGIQVCDYSHEDQENHE
jgi:hypothetical protein